MPLTLGNGTENLAALHQIPSALKSPNLKEYGYHLLIPLALDCARQCLCIVRLAPVEQVLGHRGG